MQSSTLPIPKEVWILTDGPRSILLNISPPFFPSRDLSDKYYIKRASPLLHCRISYIFMKQIQSKLN